MAISYIGGASGTTSATLPTHVANDFIFAWVFRDGSTTAPTIPSGWIAAGANGGVGTAHTSAFYQIATAPGTATGTWTGATTVAFAVYRGVSTTYPILTTTSTSITTGNSITYPALAGYSNASFPSGTWVIGAIAHRSVDTTIETPPTGMTNRVTVVDATDEAAIHDTNGAVSTWNVQTVNFGGTVSTCVARTIALLDADSVLSTAILAGTATSSVSFEANETINWLNTGNAIASDNADASITVAISATAFSQRLKVSAFSGLTIPAGASIIGIVTRVEARVSIAGSFFVMVTAGTGGGLVFGDIESNMSATTADAEYTLSPAAANFETWGGVATSYASGLTGPRTRAWVASDFNSNFSVNIYCANNAARSGFVDNVRLQVFYANLVGAVVYTNTSSGSQSYISTAPALSAYSNTAVSSQTYATSYLALSAYSNTAVSSQTYATSYLALSAYSNNSTSSQTYATSYLALSAYSNTSTSSQTYAIDVGVATTQILYSNNSTSSQTYAT